MKKNRSLLSIMIGISFAATMLLPHSPVSAQVVLDHQKISDTAGNFLGALDDGDVFGWVPENIGDLDGDGVSDIAVGAPNDDDGGSNKGAVWILFLNADGTVSSHRKISDRLGRFNGVLDSGDGFGHSIAPIGDFDKDGVRDIAVGALGDDDGGPNRGAFWLLFLNNNGTVKNHQKVSDTEGNFNGALDDEDGFGHGITRVGDLDGDGTDELAAATGHITHEGVIWVLFMNADGTVRNFQRITEDEGGFDGDLDPAGGGNGAADEFGHDLDALGDFDGDGVFDLIAGAPHDDDGGTDRGALYLLFLNPNGTVKTHQKISQIEGSFMGALDDEDVFGHPPKNAGDLNGDGVIDLLVGAPFDDDGDIDIGALWILFLNEDGTVRDHEKVSQTQGGFTGMLTSGDLFSHIVSSMGDLNGDGFSDFAVGAPADDDGGDDRGAIWMMFTNLLAGENGEDDDGDGVPNDIDLCAGTVISEAVPSSGSLGQRRYALMDGDGTFESNPTTLRVRTIEDTGGCSCEQIIAELELDDRSTVRGCHALTIRDWVNAVP